MTHRVRGSHANNIYNTQYYNTNIPYLVDTTIPYSVYSGMSGCTLTDARLMHPACFKK